MPRYILTGAPGAGKTEIIRRLQAQGLSVVHEAATEVIARQQARGVAEPWTRPGFLEAIVELQRERQLNAPSAELQFYDRSPVCTYALAVFLGRPTPPSLARELERIARDEVYAKQVFFIENLGFCEPTAARRISFEDSLRFEAVHAAVYQELGYSCTPIPRGEVAERAARILAQASAVEGLSVAAPRGRP